MSKGVEERYIPLNFKRLNSQIILQCFVENVNKSSTFYYININPQYIIFLKLKPKTFKKHKIMSIS